MQNISKWGKHIQFRRTKRKAQNNNKIFELHFILLEGKEFAAKMTTYYKHVQYEAYDVYVRHESMCATTSLCAI